MLLMYSKISYGSEGAEDIGDYLNRLQYSTFSHGSEGKEDGVIPD